MSHPARRLMSHPACPDRPRGSLRLPPRWVLVGAGTLAVAGVWASFAAILAAVWMFGGGAGVNAAAAPGSPAPTAAEALLLSGETDEVAPARFRSEYPAAADRRAAARGACDLTAEQYELRPSTAPGERFEGAYRFAGRGDWRLLVTADDAADPTGGARWVRSRGPAGRFSLRVAADGATEDFSLHPPDDAAGRKAREAKGAGLDRVLYRLPYAPDTGVAHSGSRWLTVAEALDHPGLEIVAAGAGVTPDGPVVRIGWRFAGDDQSDPAAGVWTFLPERSWAMAERRTGRPGEAPHLLHMVEITYDPPDPVEPGAAPVPARVEETPGPSDPFASGWRDWEVRTALGPAPAADAFAPAAFGLPDLNAAADPAIATAAGVTAVARPAGVMTAGKSGSLSVTVRNGTDRPLSVAGMNDHCAPAGCVSGDDAGWPVAVPAGGTAAVTVGYKPLRAGPLTVPIFFYTDHPDAPTVAVTLSGGAAAR